MASAPCTADEDFLMSAARPTLGAHVLPKAGRDLVDWLNIERNIEVANQCAAPVSMEIEHAQ